MAEVNPWITPKTGPVKWSTWVGGSRRRIRAARLADVSKANIEITRGIMEQARSLQKKGNRKESNALLDLAEKLVANNDNVLEVAGEIRDDAK